MYRDNRQGIWFTEIMCITAGESRASRAPDVNDHGIYTKSGFTGNFPRHLQTKISLGSLVCNHSNQFEMSELHSLAEKCPRKQHSYYVKIHIVWHAIKIYNYNIDYVYICIHRVHTKAAQVPWNRSHMVSYRSKRMRNRWWETSCCPITRSGSSHVDEWFTAWYCSSNWSCSKKFKWNHLYTQKITFAGAWRVSNESGPSIVSLTSSHHSVVLHLCHQLSFSSQHNIR